MRRSKWHEFKGEAIRLRKAGRSVRKIEAKLGIPRSTLSGWFKDVELTQTQKNKLRKDWMNALAAARKKAVVWHKKEKRKRIVAAEKEAQEVLSKVDTTDKATLEITLALLYLGEGTKKSLDTALGSSDPLILRFFITSLQKIYHVETAQIRGELHLRADQDITKLKRYWSRSLDLPLKNFTYATIDKRTRGSKTYPGYHGVCNIRCGNVAIKRRLIFLSRLFCSKVAGERLGS